jgi:gentisate 1,2-dioxygenase
MSQTVESLPETGVDYGDFIQQRYKGKKLLHKGLQFTRTIETGKARAYTARDFPTTTIGMHVAEIPPGVEAATHRHMSEAIIHILSGRGHSIINGERYDWEAGDTIFVPPLSWHQHINTQHSEPVRFIAFWSSPLFERMGLYMNEELGDKEEGVHSVTGVTYWRAGKQDQE